MQRKQKGGAERAGPAAPTMATARVEPLGNFWSRNAGILIVTAIAAVLILANLGGTCLWADEGDTAVLAKSILVNGVPKAWDGTTFTDSDTGKRLNDDLLQVVHPWVPFYLAAASIGVLGDSSFAARLPFALAALANVPLVYLLVRRMGFDRRTALIAAILLLGSVQFLLYARQARHYSLNMLLTCLLVYLAMDLGRWRGRVLFGLTAIVLFHCHPLPALAVLGAVGFLTIAWRPWRPYLAGFWMTLPVVLLLTLPWLALSVVGLQENSAFPEGVGDTFGARASSFLIHTFRRIMQFASEVSELVPWLLWLGLLPFAITRRSPELRNFVVVFGTVLAALAAMNIATQSVAHMWDLGVRYACAWIPLGACLTAVLIAQVTRGRLAWECALVGLILFTHLPDNTLAWMTLPKGEMVTGQNWGFSLHVPPDQTPKWLKPYVPRAIEPAFRAVPKVFRLEVPAFLPELWAANPGTIESVSDYLKTNARPGDRIIANYEWEPLYFHTGLPQALKVMPDYACYQAAREHNLPEYVFDSKGARWIVWRPIWESYAGYHFDKVKADIERAGGRITRVSDPKDTRWENRENVHFRRFPSPFGQLYYVYGLAGTQLVITSQPEWPAAAIYRVDWPDDASLDADAAPAG